MIKRKLSNKKNYKKYIYSNRCETLRTNKLNDLLAKKLQIRL